MAAAAMKGSVSAQKIFVELVDRARRERATEICDDHDFWRTYAANYGEHIAALQKRGNPCRITGRILTTWFLKLANT
jgi:hypothetical protein